MKAIFNKKNLMRLVAFVCTTFACSPLYLCSEYICVELALFAFAFVNGYIVYRICSPMSDAELSEFCFLPANFFDEEE